MRCTLALPISGKLAWYPILVIATLLSGGAALQRRDKRHTFNRSFSRRRKVAHVK